MVCAVKLVASFFGLAIVLSAALAAGAPPAPARYIPAEIRFDGAVVLRGSTSDDGHADVDAVWDYQKGALVYAPTAAYAALGVPADAAEWTLASPPPASTDGAAARRPMQVEVEVGYGGRASAYELRLLRVSGTDGANQWRVHPEDVERLFPRRTITREEAARLKSPKRVK